MLSKKIKLYCNWIIILLYAGTQTQIYQGRVLFVFCVVFFFKKLTLNLLCTNSQKHSTLVASVPSNFPERWVMAPAHVHGVLSVTGNKRAQTLTGLCAPNAAGEGTLLVAILFCGSSCFYCVAKKKKRHFTRNLKLWYILFESCTGEPLLFFPCTHLLSPIIHVLSSPLSMWR